MFDFVSEVIDDAVEVVDYAVSTIGDAITTVGSYVAQGVSYTYDMVSGAINNAVDYGKDLFGGGSAATPVAQAAGTTGFGSDSYTDWAGDWADEIINLGKDWGNAASTNSGGLMDFITNMDPNTQKLVGTAALMYYKDRQARKARKAAHKSAIKQIQEGKKFHGQAYV